MLYLKSKPNFASNSSITPRKVITMHLGFVGHIYFYIKIDNSGKYMVINLQIIGIPIGAIYDVLEAAI